MPRSRINVFKIEIQINEGFRTIRTTNCPAEGEYWSVWIIVGLLLYGLLTLPGCAPLSWASTIWAIWALSFASSVSSTLIFWMASSLATDEAWGSLVPSCRVGRDLRRGTRFRWGWRDRNTKPACISDLLQLESNYKQCVSRFKVTPHNGCGLF